MSERGEIVVQDGEEFIRDARGELVPHQTREVNGGRLRIGNPGNKGGGRKSNEQRRLLMETADKLRTRVDFMLTDAEIGKLTPDQVAKLLDTTLKYSIGTKQTHVGDDDGPLKMGVVVLPPLGGNGEG